MIDLHASFLTALICLLPLKTSFFTCLMSLFQDKRDAILAEAKSLIDAQENTK